MASRLWASLHSLLLFQRTQHKCSETSLTPDLLAFSARLLRSQNLWSLRFVMQQSSKRALSRQVLASWMESSHPVRSTDPWVPWLLQESRTAPSSVFWPWLPKMNFHSAVKPPCPSLGITSTWPFSSSHFCALWGLWGPNEEVCGKRKGGSLHLQSWGSSGITLKRMN